MKTKYILYYVEGETEEKLINILKTDLGAIKAGKVQTLNVVEQKITNARLMTLRLGTMVVLIFDTDTGNIDILNNNIKKLKECPAISELVTIPQVHNLEEELLRSCDVRGIKDLLGSKSKKDFKSDFIKDTNLASKLKKHNFNINNFWNSKPSTPYQNIENLSEKIKIIK